MTPPSLKEVLIEYPNFPECPSCSVHNGIREEITLPIIPPDDEFYIPPELLELETIIIMCEPAMMERSALVNTSYHLGYHKKDEPDFGGVTTGGVSQRFACPARIRLLREVEERRNIARK